MSTRCHVEIVDYYDDVKRPRPDGEGCILLYHHSDGYPEFQMPKIKAFLEGAAQILIEKRWWDDERVAAYFVAWSAEAYAKPSFGVDESGDDNTGFPTYQPAACIHGDVVFHYVVELRGNDEARISAYDILDGLLMETESTGWVSYNPD